MFDKYIEILFAIALTFCTILLAFLTICVIFFPEKVKADDVNPITCEAYAKDIGHITGIGKDRWTAQGNAAIECHRRRVELHKKVKGEYPDYERALLYIDSCINIECKGDIKNEIQGE